MTAVGLEAKTRTTSERGPAERSLHGLRVAVVHYWLTGYGGGEKALEQIAEIFPQADFYALVATPRGVPPWLRGRSLTTSIVGRIPGAKLWHRHFLPLYPFAIEQFDLSDYDLVISSESGPAKGVITAPRTCHVCYCLSPMRYLWDMYHAYRRTMNPLTRALFSLTAHYVRQWDLNTAARVDYFAVISRYVAARVQKYYRRESTVIYPPVDVSAGYISPTMDTYYLAVSRLVPYKRLDLAIHACNQLQRRLRIVGKGPEYKRLRKMAGPSVEFLDQLKDSELRECYARCRALIFPAEEDFGIVPVEAQSFGRPVIAYGRGASLETVIGVGPSGNPERASGILFPEQTVEALSKAIARFESLEARFCSEFIREQAQRFSLERFQIEFREYIANKLAEYRQDGGEWCSGAT